VFWGSLFSQQQNWMIHFDSLPAGGCSRLPGKLRFPQDLARSNEMSRVRVARLQLQGILISQVPCRAELFIRYYWSCIAVLLRCAFVRGISTVPGCRTRVAGTVPRHSLDNSNSELSEHNVVIAGRMQKLERNPTARELREPITFPQLR